MERSLEFLERSAIGEKLLVAQNGRTSHSAE
jgi:hypothetical protein